jgi:hypothetical protein
MKRSAKRSKLRVVRHKTRDRCGKDVVWCGPGSHWDNPWRARQSEPLVANAIHRAHIQFNNPPWVNAGGILHGPRHARPAEKALALAGLYRVWLTGRVAEMPDHLRVAMKAAIEGDAPAHAFDLPSLKAPPPRHVIREALRGRTLADSAARTHATHAYALIEIANTPEEAKP